MRYMHTHQTVRHFRIFFARSVACETTTRWSGRCCGLPGGAVAYQVEWEVKFQSFITNSQCQVDVTLHTGIAPGVNHVVASTL